MRQPSGLPAVSRAAAELASHSLSDERHNSSASSCKATGSCWQVGYMYISSFPPEACGLQLGFKATVSMLQDKASPNPPPLTLSSEEMRAAPGKSPWPENRYLSLLRFRLQARVWQGAIGLNLQPPHLLHPIPASSVLARVPGEKAHL